jgi:hypothetical protein
MRKRDDRLAQIEREKMECADRLGEALRRISALPPKEDA